MENIVKQYPSGRIVIYIENKDMELEFVDSVIHKYSNISRQIHIFMKPNCILYRKTICKLITAFPTISIRLYYDPKYINTDIVRRIYMAYYIKSNGHFQWSSDTSIMFSISKEKYLVAQSNAAGFKFIKSAKISA